MRLVTSTDTVPAIIAVAQMSMIRNTLRTALGPNDTGWPVAVSTRSPFQRLPGVRPPAHTSNAMS